jgi:quercetin dioxygenase-like cupin family protein
MRKTIGAVGLGFAALLATAGNGFTEEMALVPSSAIIKWAPGPASLPKGVQLAALAGDPGRPGPFALRVKIPPNTVIAPHWHATAENLTVLSGPLFHEMGDKLDKSRGEEMEAGGFVYLPAKMNHSVWTTTFEAIVQVTGTGPFGVNYANPADDPSKSQ